MKENVYILAGSTIVGVVRFFYEETEAIYEKTHEDIVYREVWTKFKKAITSGLRLAVPAPASTRR